MHADPLASHSTPLRCYLASCGRRAERRDGGASSVSSDSYAGSALLCANHTGLILSAAAIFVLEEEHTFSKLPPLFSFPLFMSGAGVLSFPSPFLARKPATAIISIGDAELWGPGIPSIKKAWGLWAILGAVTLMLFVSLVAHLSQWTSGRSRSHSGQGRSGGSVEEAPLYGNLHYLQTGRLSQEPRPEQQDPAPGGPTRAAEEAMCYTSLQLWPPQGRVPSPGAPIKYSEVVLDSEPKAKVSDPEPELYASVCAQTRRARTSFPDQAYANSQLAPS
ncbi:PREDICTED: signaling threshold-regulating transmembrane adapter 1 [Chrysochloris asiatica]|uniref:Signaling threshold-regulating transmembrane adapter 1 n=1 Tax=Chrysochloris asiatica TaxID=185453 RepID=A0A9B0WMM8_CHRAS|nr:PREDICTED: signaling threshold-regulating transmembrane adapter 1 [Chrysochloris asiatica]